MKTQQCNFSTTAERKLFFRLLSFFFFVPSFLSVTQFEKKRESKRTSEERKKKTSETRTRRPFSQHRALLCGVLLFSFKGSSLKSFREWSVYPSLYTHVRHTEVGLGLTFMFGSACGYLRPPPRGARAMSSHSEYAPVPRHI